jgi:transcriptional regulator with XRE-family HTH domain
MTAAFIPQAMRLKQARVEAKLTQGQLAELSGVDQSNISKIEHSKQNATTETFDRLISAITDHLGHSPVTLDAIDGVIGVVGRTQGKLVTVDPMAAPRAKDWMAEGFLARRYVTVLSGQEGAGKSYAAQTLVTALVRGDSQALGMNTPGVPLRALVVDAENIMVVDDDIDGTLALERFQTLGITSDNCHRLTITGAQGFDLDTDADALDAAVGDIKANSGLDVVVLDTLMSLTSLSDTNNDGMHRLLTKLNRLAMRHDVAVLLIHHMTKAGDKYSGAKAIGSTVAAVFTFARVIYKDPETGKKAQHPTLRFLSVYKQRIAPEPATLMLQVGPNGVTVPNSKIADEWSSELDDEGDDE